MQFGLVQATAGHQVIDQTFHHLPHTYMCISITHLLTYKYADAVRLDLEKVVHMPASVAAIINEGLSRTLKRLSSFS